MPLAATRQDAIAELFATPSVVAERRADGSFIVRSTVPLGPSDRAVGVWLERWAAERPDKVFLAERIDTKGPWSTISYGEARKRVRAAAGWMIAQRMSAERPLAILSDNAVEHAILALGAMHAGIPVATISSAYSLVSKDFEKLRAAIALLDPGAIYVSDAAPFAAALAAIKTKPSRRRRCRQECREGGRRRRGGHSRDARQRCGLAGVCGRRTGHDREIPVHLGLNRRAESRHQHPWHADLEPGGEGAGVAVPADEANSSCSTGCRGATPSAPTTTSTWCCATAARSTSTRASRRRACSPPRSTICAA